MGKRVLSCAAAGIIGMVAVLAQYGAGMAIAANIPYSMSVTPFAGGYLFEGNQHITDRPVYGISAGYNLGEHWGLEATYSAVPDAKATSSTQVSAKSGVEKALIVHEMRGDILYHFLPDQRLVPYVAAGVGGLLLDPRNGPANADFLVDYGAGLKFFLSDAVALRADMRHIFDITFHDLSSHRSVYNNFAYTAGVTFQIGGVQPASTAVAAQKQVPVAETRLVPAEPAPPIEPTPTPAPPAKVAPAPAAAKAATQPWAKRSVMGITASGDTIEILTSNWVGYYKTFRLSKPARLVIDISDASNDLKVQKMQVKMRGIAAVRIGTHPDFVRVVIDAAEAELPSYRIVQTEKGLKVILEAP